MPYLVKAHLLPLDKYGTIGGRDTESDDDYRYRIQLSLFSRTGSEPDLRGALLKIPGLQDVVFERLSGTFNVYVYGISPEVPASLLAMVQSELDRLAAYPLTGLALAPDLVGITVSTRVSLAGTVSSADSASILSAAQAAAADYINNLAIGEVLVLNEVADRMRSADSRIFDVGRPNQPLNEVFLWRSRADGTRGASAEIHSSLPLGYLVSPVCRALVCHPPKSLPSRPD